MKVWLVVCTAIFTALAVFVAAFPFPAFAVGEAQKLLLKKSGNSKLFLLTPPGGEQKDSLLMLELNEKSPYGNGYQHGALLADNIADVVSNRYSCISQDILDWVQDSYYKMPRDFQDEIRGIADGLSAKGYQFPFAKVVLHATQPITATAVGFPWFVCPWSEGRGPTGSWSFAVLKRYIIISGNSPDWGKTPKSLARNHVLVLVFSGYTFRYAYLGVPGVVGMPGVNEIGLSIAGTSGQLSVKPVTAMPGNGVPIPDGFMTPFMMGAHVLRNFSGSDPLVYDRFEEVLRRNPVDGFIVQITTQSGSALWESGGAASQDYPHNSRRMVGRMAGRMAGEWDSGNITPVDWRGDFLLLPGSVLRISALPFPAAVDFTDSAGEPYAGRAWINGAETRWQRMQVGRAFALPSDPGRASRFANWFARFFARLFGESRDTPFVVSEKANGGNPHIISVLPDKTGGWWVLADGSGYGSWVRDGDSAFRAYNADGSQVCAGPLYDFGNGVTGWCRLNAETDIEWVAWTHKYPDGAFERLDGMNLSVLPQLKQFARVAFPLFGGPHTRTHFLMRELGAPHGALTLDEFYKTFQRAYLAVGTEDDPFGVGAYDLSSGDALFTVSRYEGGRYIGGLNPEQKPIKLNRYQLFGW